MGNGVIPLSGGRLATRWSHPEVIEIGETVGDARRILKGRDVKDVFVRLHSPDTLISLFVSKRMVLRGLRHNKPDEKLRTEFYIVGRYTAGSAWVGTWR